LYTIPPQQQTLLSSLEENEEEEKNKNLIDILSYTPTPLNNKQFENVLSETTTTALSSGGSSCADFDDPKDKKYFCQRCLNHKEVILKRNDRFWGLILGHNFIYSELSSLIFISIESSECKDYFSYQDCFDQMVL